MKSNNSKKNIDITSFILLIGLVPIILLGTTVGPQTSVYAGSNNDEVSCYERGMAVSR
jgi:hypothetical protein